MKCRLRLQLLLFCCALCLFAVAQIEIPQEWKGKIKEGKNTYAYTLTLERRVGDSVFGTSTSASQGFFCETAFRGMISGTKFRIREIRIIRMNYKGTEEICLMDVQLNATDKKMNGTFTSSNSKRKDCGSGSIALTRIDQQEKEAAAPAAPTQAEKIVRSPSAPLPLPQSSISVKRELDKRELQVIDRLQFSEDSAVVTIYDNGVIDDDFISLVINDRIVFDKVKLGTTPLSYTLKRKEGERFSIAFHAETLGTIPPNTGLIIITAGPKRKELLFSSDLQKTATVLIELIEKVP